MAAILEHAMTYGIDDVSRLPQLVRCCCCCCCDKLWHKVSLLYWNQSILPRKSFSRMKLPVNVNAGRLRNSSWCKCGECSEMLSPSQPFFGSSRNGLKSSLFPAYSNLYYRTIFTPKQRKRKF